jgi:hypothetical protein
MDGNAPAEDHPHRQRTDRTLQAMRFFYQLPIGEDLQELRWQVYATSHRPVSAKIESRKSRTKLDFSAEYISLKNLFFCVDRIPAVCYSLG